MNVRWCGFGPGCLDRVSTVSYVDLLLTCASHTRLRSENGFLSSLCDSRFYIFLRLQAHFLHKEIQCFWGKGPSPPTGKKLPPKMPHTHLLAAKGAALPIPTCAWPGRGNHRATIFHHSQALFGFGSAAQGPPWWSELCTGRSPKSNGEDVESVVVGDTKKDAWKCLNNAEMIWKCDKTQQLKEPWTFSWIIFHLPFLWSRHVKMIKNAKNGYISITLSSHVITISKLHTVWCMVPFFATPPVELLTSPDFEATGWGVRPVFGRITRIQGVFSPAPAWRKEAKGIIPLYMALIVLRSPGLKTTWRFRTISDKTAIGNVGHEPPFPIANMVLICFHRFHPFNSIQSIDSCLLSPASSNQRP